MSVKLKYQGKQFSRNKNQQSYKETYYGTETEIDTFMLTLPSISSNVSGKGYFTRYSKTQSEGSIYQLECEYTVEYDDSFSNTSSTIVGVKSAKLSSRNIQMPLESVEGYRTNWNYFLIGLGQDAAIPDFWETATNILIPVAYRKKYNWVKSYGEIPTDKDQETNLFWYPLAMPTKPGVEYKDLEVYVVTQSSKYNSQQAAGAALQTNINKIVSPSSTFGISWGNWKYDEASIDYDGKHWITTASYTHSGDSLGWDTDLYG